jgi:hypothetical protein
VNINEGKDEFLKGLTAKDGKDGDLTQNIIIESISKFVERGVSNITYAVFDSDNHVTKYTRKVRYTDYYSPRFTFSKELRFNVGESFSLLDYIGAVDAIEGDISDRIKIISSNLNTSIEGAYEFTAQVTNSKGDVSYLTADIIIENNLTPAPVIVLTDYIKYIKKGESIENIDFIKSVTKSDGFTPIEKSIVTCDSNVDAGKAGIYKMVYRVEDDGSFFAATLVVIVEE